MSQQAGWYPDPAGRHETRYWDGSRWTDNVSDGGVVVAERPDVAVEPQPAPVPSAPAAGPFTFRPYKRPTPFIGDMALSVEGAQLDITGHVVAKADARKTVRVLMGTVLGGLVAYLAVIFAMINLDDQSAEEGSDTAFGAVAIVGLLVWILAIIAVAVWAPSYQRHHATQATIRTATGLVEKVRPRYDWNIGVLWMLLLSPVIGLIITLARGKRVLELRFAEPLVAGDRDPFRTMIIKGHRRADADDLAAVLRLAGPGRS